MKRSIPGITIASFLCLTVVLGCGTQTPEFASELHSPSGKQSSSHQANNESLAGVQHSTKLTIADPISYNNLTVFPIVSDRSLSDDQFITLDEGLASEKVEVFEGDDDDNPFGGDEDRETNIEDPLLMTRTTTLPTVIRFQVPNLQMYRLPMKESWMVLDHLLPISNR